MRTCTEYGQFDCGWDRLMSTDQCGGMFSRA